MLRFGLLHSTPCNIAEKLNNIIDKNTCSWLKVGYTHR